MNFFSNSFGGGGGWA